MLPTLKLTSVLKPFAACTVLLFPLAFGGTAQAAEIGPEVGKPLKAAQEAMQKKKWDEAMVNIKAAQAVKDKSAFEQYNINELQAYVLLRVNDTAGAVRLYEQNLASGQVPAGEMPNRIKTLAQLNFQIKNYPKAIEYGQRWLKGNGADDPAAYLLVAQSHYLQRDYRNAARIMQTGIDTARRVNKPVEENWLLLKLNSLYSMPEKDEDAIIATREQLVRSFPKPNYWRDLLEMLSRKPDVGSDDRVKLGFYRLMLEMGALSRPEDYVEMAQMDMETGVPGEAVTVIQKGFETKVLDTPRDRSRNERVLAAARAQLQTVQQSLAQREKEAAASPAGELDVQLGANYLSLGQADKAIPAIQRGLKKGGVKRMDDAQVLLGRAFLLAKNKDEARRAFLSVPEDSKLRTIATLWALRAQQS